jgi:hypothetical protein
MKENILKIALCSVSLILFAWLMVSWFDIVNNNLATCDYWEYNIIVLFANLK